MVPLGLARRQFWFRCSGDSARDHQKGKSHEAAEFEGRHLENEEACGWLFSTPVPRLSFIFVKRGHSGRRQQ